VHTVRSYGACLVGASAQLITVEALFEPVDRQRTEVVLLGLPDPVIRESRGRLLCALEENGLSARSGRLVLNLVPTGLRKAGEILDLPLVIGAAAALGHLDPAWLDGALFLGEVGIDGRLHPVPGGLAAAELAQRSGLARVLAPAATAREAAHQPGIESYALDDLRAALGLLSGARKLAPLAPPPGEPARIGELAGALDEVRGQAAGKRALCVAAAGGHGLVFVGPPGTGKSMLARGLCALLPPLSPAEALEVTRVQSAAGRWPGGVARQRPLRAPHHTASHSGLVGGGSPPQPGEITLAHAGVLFLDELPEFRRDALEALRQPLETGSVSISRAGAQIELPARFQLVAAMNPCPCGYLGHPRIPCRCTPLSVQRYRQRVSGPLLDRIELRVELPAPAVEDFATRRRAPGEDGLALAERVARARERSRARQGELRNCDIASEALDAYAALTPEGWRMLERATQARGLSARALQSLRRVARTIADLDELEAVGPGELAQALALRSGGLE